MPDTSSAAESRPPDRPPEYTPDHPPGAPSNGLNGRIRAGFRLTLLLIFLLSGLLISLIQFGWMKIRRRPHLSIAWWYRGALRIIGVRIVHADTPPTRSMVAISNHISWIDIAVLGVVLDPCFLSKAEVANWPVVGWGARLSGTVFLRRGANQSAQAIADLRKRMAHNRSVLIFAEGTTTIGPMPRRFFARLFAAAIDTETDILPIAIRYPDPYDPMRTNPSVPYVDDQSLLERLWALMQEPVTPVEIYIGQPLKSVGRDRRGLSRETHNRVSKLISMAQTKQKDLTC